MWKKIRSSEKGSAMVEAAVTLPLLMLLFLGILEFGRILMIQQMITNAARESARAGAIYLDDTSALTAAQNVAQDYMTQSGLDLSAATVTPVFSEVNGTQAIQVDIHYDYASNLAGWIPDIGNITKLNSRVIMRRES